MVFARKVTSLQNVILISWEKGKFIHTTIHLWSAFWAILIFIKFICLNRSYSVWESDEKYYAYSCHGDNDDVSTWIQSDMTR